MRTVMPLPTSTSKIPLYVCKRLYDNEEASIRFPDSSIILLISNLVSDNEIDINRIIDESWKRIEASSEQGLGFLQSVLDASEKIDTLVTRTYHLIDFGSPEPVDEVSYAYTLLSSFSPSSCPPDPTDRQTFSLLASLLEIAAEGDETPYPRPSQLREGENVSEIAADFFKRRAQYFGALSQSANIPAKRKAAARTCLELLAKYQIIV